MSPQKRQRVSTPVFQSERARPAEQLLRVDPQEEDRALILGQLAALLAAHSRIGPLIAFKGGAIMHLVDGSARLSRDLDGAIASGKPLRRAWVTEALSTDGARRVVVSLPRIVNENAKSLVYPELICHSLNRRGHATVGVSFSINWDDPLLEPPILATIQLLTRSAKIPVLSRAERATEKVRTFLTRGEARDAYDLHHYGARTLSAADWKKQPRFVRHKLAHAVDLPQGTNLHQLWDTQTELAHEAYERDEGLVLRAPKPLWSDVLVQLRRFKGCVPPQVETARTRRRSA